MLSVLLVLAAALLTIGAGELVRSKCRRMLSTPVVAAPLAGAAEDGTAAVRAST